MRYKAVLIVQAQAYEGFGDTDAEAVNQALSESFNVSSRSDQVLTVWRMYGENPEFGYTMTVNMYLDITR